MKKLKFKWGVIGTGGIAKAFSEDIKKLNNHGVSAVLSRSEINAKNFSSSFQECKGYTNMDDFLYRSDIDAVYVATPNTLHCNQTIESLNAGIPVLCEKPLSMNIRETKQMIKASADNNTALLDGMWMRYLPHMEKIRNIVSDETIGSIESISACHGQNLKKSKNPRLWTKELGGGALLDLGIYVVSFAHMLLGAPKSIIAQSVFTDKGVDAKTSMLFNYENGAIANLTCSMYDSQPNRAIISGSEGYIEIEPTFYAPTSFKIFLNDGKLISHPNKYKGHGLREQALELEKCKNMGLIESEKSSHSESITVMESMDKIRSLVGLKF